MTAAISTSAGRLNRWGRRALVAVAAFAAVMVAWTLAARSYGSPILFPGPGDTFEGLWSEIRSGDLVRPVLASLRRIFTGFIIGCSFGTILGLLAGRSRTFWWMLEPLVNFFRFVPPLAWFAPALLLFGAGERSQVALIVYTTMFVVLVNTMAGVHVVSKSKTRMVANFGASTWVTLWRVTLPASIPYVLAGMRIALGNAFMTVVTAEMLGASAGLGVQINNGMITLNMVSVLSAIIVLGVLGLGSDVVFGRIAGRVNQKYGVRT